ncbi:hypothetical protein GCM10011390_47750 [Aureimonas endophytica]|uniref:Glycosyl transferase family 29 (Putative sialyltransferase) n=1 Tax=Aureimonas endophytica TaxID=2027858 RepID=A0A917A335_9HYPH|nr:hypothetical protein [Aureimonas endophytica]GGE22793.1 hypothetical protein GCM10011390_47750 [Aureimonas endophytica]
MPSSAPSLAPPAPALPAHVAIVGNAPGAALPAPAIDAADWVVRFNNAPGFDGRAGRRVTHLALVNHGGQMREWLADPGFRDRPAVRAAERFLFPFGRKSEPVEAQGEDGRDWTKAALAMLAPLGRPVDLLPPAIPAEAGRLLAMPERPVPVPSTGFLVTLYLLRSLPAATRIEVFGFGFSGWDGHSWTAERRWFEAMAAANRLRLHPVAGAPA